MIMRENRKRSSDDGPKPRLQNLSPDIDSHRLVAWNTDRCHIAMSRIPISLVHSGIVNTETATGTHQGTTQSSNGLA